MFDKEFSLPNITNYQVCSKAELPAFFLGFKIYNDYEDDNIVIPKHLHPQKLIHVLDDGPCFLYGTILRNVNNHYKTLINNIYYKHLFEFGCSINDYASLLDCYNLSFDSCYKHFKNGVYPIDLKHITSITNNVVQLSSVLCDYLQISGQVMNNVGGLNLFLLTKCF